jgi:phage antirepressor YoqD-like protein
VLKVEERNESKSQAFDEAKQSNEENEADEPKVIEKNDVTWSKHCVDLVRKVANFIQSTFRE